MAESTVLGEIAVRLSATTADFDKSIDRVNKQMDRFGKKMTKVGSNLTQSVTAPVVALGGAAVYMTAQFDDSMSKVSALSGAVGDDLGRLRDLAKEMGSQTKFSASQSADAMQYLALAGYDTNQILASTPAMLQLAAAAGMDLARSADIVTDTMSAFQMEASRAGEAADVFALAQAKSNTNVEQLGEAMKYAAPAANAFQQNMQQTAAMLGVFADSGIKGSMAGTTFVSMMEDMKKSAKDGAISIGKTSVALYDAQGNARAMADIMEDVEKATAGMTTQQRDAALGAVFQTRSLKGVNVVMATGTKRLRELESELNNSEGAAAKMAETMEDNLGGSLRSLKSATEGVLISFGEVLAPAVGRLAESLKGLMHWFDSLSTTTKKWLVVASGIAAAIGPVLLALGALSSLIPMILGGFAAMLGPIGLAVVALGALAAAFAYVATRSSTAADTSQEATDSFRKQKGQVQDLEKNFKPLLARHDELKNKTNRSAKENKELDDIIAQISKTVPGAITGFDEYGKILGVSTDKAREFVEQQKAILEVKNAEAIREQETNLKKLNAELDVYQRTIKEAQGRLAVSTDEGEVSRMKKVITELGAEIAKVQRQKLGTTGLIDELKGVEPEVKKTSAAIQEQTQVTEKQAAAVSLLAAQHELLKKAQEDKANAGSFNEIGAANKRIEAIQKEIDWLESLQLTGNEVYKDLAEASTIGSIAPIEIEWKLAKAIKGWDAAIKGVITDDNLGTAALRKVNEQFKIAEKSAKVFGDSYDLIGEKSRALQGALNTLIQNGVDPQSEAFKYLKAEFEGLTEVMQKQAQTAIDLAPLLSNAIVGMAESIGDAFSNVNGDISGLQVFFNGIVGVVGQFLGTLGQQLIAAGIASEAFKKLAVTGVPAIAAGVALIALSKVVSNSMSKNPMGGGSSAGGGGSASPGAGLEKKETPFVVQGEWKASGTELKLVMKNQDRKDGRTGG